MKIVEPDANIIADNNQLKLIERIGRICYKSEDKITDTSCYPFIYNLFEREHYAMLEHGHIHVKAYQLSDEEKLDILNIPYVVLDEIEATSSYYRYALITISYSHIAQYAKSNGFIADVYRQLSWFDTKLDEAFSFMSKDIPENCTYGLTLDTLYILDENEFKELCVELDDYQLYNRHCFHSVHFICDRGVSHELVRHRCSVAQESTRYCNYSLDKFGGEISFVRTVNIPEDMNSEAYRIWLKGCQSAEYNYTQLLELGLTPQDARSVLPNSLKTEVVLTMNRNQLKHFINLRYRGTTGYPHPDMQYVVNKLVDKYPSMLKL